MPNGYRTKILRGILIAAVPALVLGWYLVRLGERITLREIASQLESQIATTSALVYEILSTPMTVVRLMAGEGAVIRALEQPHATEAVAEANRLMDRYQEISGVSVTGVYTAEGRILATYAAGRKFLGSDLSFRPYIRNALQGKDFQYLALGHNEKRRGYYASTPVRGRDGRILGVAMVKSEIREDLVGLDNAEQAFFVSPDGIVFLSSDPDLCYRALRPVPEPRLREIRDSRQFGDQPLEALQIAWQPELREAAWKNTRYVYREVRVGPEGWRLFVFKDTRPLVRVRYVMTAISFGLFLLAALGICAFVREKETARLLAAANTQLEARVEARTEDLRESNAELRTQVAHREQVEKALQDSHELFTTIDAAARDAIIMIDDTGRVTYWSRACEPTFGYSREEMLGRNLHRVLAPERFRDPQRKAFEGFRQAGRGTAIGKTIELVAKRKDGSVFPIELSLSSVRIRERWHAVGIIRDITERLKSQQEKEELQEKLARSRKMEALGLLAGGVAHDLNNVLSGIVSYPDLLLLDMPEGDPLRDPIETIRESGQKATVIVQDLLTLARRGVTTFAVISLNDIVNDYLSSPEHIKLLSYHPNVRIHTRLEPGLPHIKGSPFHLKKMVMNLVSNAAEAQPAGGEILLQTESRYLDRPIRGYEKIVENEYIVLKIEDNGEGIPQGDLHRIFEPFYTKKVMGRSGTGLGMAVVWGTVQDHSGYIDVASTEGVGTAFELYLPMTRKKPATVPKHDGIERYMGRRESVLVVDDMANQRLIAQKILTKLNYQATTVPSGEAALEYLKSNSADLVLLDMIMDPGIDGLNTYRRILEIHPAQKAIIASGFAETDRVKEAQQFGVGAYVKKPYTLEKIGRAVRDELDRNRENPDHGNSGSHSGCRPGGEVEKT